MRNYKRKSRKCKIDWHGLPNGPNIWSLWPFWWWLVEFLGVSTLESGWSILGWKLGQSPDFSSDFSKNWFPWKNPKSKISIPDISRHFWPSPYILHQIFTKNSWNIKSRNVKPEFLKPILKRKICVKNFLIHFQNNCKRILWMKFSQKAGMRKIIWSKRKFLLLHKKLGKFMINSKYCNNNWKMRNWKKMGWFWWRNDFPNWNLRETIIHNT